MQVDKALRLLESPAQKEPEEEKQDVDDQPSAILGKRDMREDSDDEDRSVWLKLGRS